MIRGACGLDDIHIFKKNEISDSQKFMTRLNRIVEREIVNQKTAFCDLQLKGLSTCSLKLRITLQSYLYIYVEVHLSKQSINRLVLEDIDSLVKILVIPL